MVSPERERWFAPYTSEKRERSMREKPPSRGPVTKLDSRGVVREKHAPRLLGQLRMSAARRPLRPPRLPVYEGNDAGRLELGHVLARRQAAPAIGHGLGPRSF